MMDISIELKDSIEKIESRILSALSKKVNLLINKNKIAVTRIIQNKIESWILNQPEIKSLNESSPSSLASLFGIRPSDTQSAINNIVLAVKNSIFIQIESIDKNLNGSIRFSFQPDDFLNLLSLKDGHVITKKGQDLHWLDWLLTRGDQVIIFDYKYDPTAGRGRSGGGIMTKGGSFRVPPEYSGTLNNNFITRAFAGREKELQNALMELFK